MKFKKILFGITVTFLLSAGIVYAASSSDYLTKAQSYIDENCDRPNLSEKTSLDCYLFHKVNEPTFGSAALKTFDANGNELGIYVDYDTFFSPLINKLVNIDIETGEVTMGSIYSGSGGGNGYIYYKELNCAGAAYFVPGSAPLTIYLNQMYPEINGKYYVIDENIPLSSSALTMLSGSEGTNNCLNTNNTNFKAYTLREALLSLPNPVSLPLQFKYQ